MSYVTPAVISLDEGIYEIDMPSRVAVGTDIYVFLRWDDGSTNPVKTVPLTSDITLTATYALVPPLNVTVSPTSGKAQVGQNLTFIGQASGGTPPYTYQWLMDGIPQAGQTSPSITITSDVPASELLSLVVADSLGVQAASSTVTATFTVAPAPTPPVQPLLPNVRNILYPIIPGIFDRVDKRRSEEDK